MTSSEIDETLRDLRPRPVLLREGHSDRELLAGVRHGAIERVRHGVHARPSEEDNRYVRAREEYLRRSLAHAVSAPAAVLSHLSGVAFHGATLARAPLDTVHLIRPGARSGRRRPGLWFHAGALAEDDVMTCAGIRVTTPARSLVDMARFERRRDAVAIIDHALHTKLVDADAVAAALARASRGRGLPAARRAVALADGRSESVGESCARLAFREVGLPTPELQVEVYSAGGVFLGRCDFGYVGAGVLIEFDGREKYQRYRRQGESIGDMVLREKQREDALREAGFIVIRLVWADLSRPWELAQRLRDALARGERAMANRLITGRCVVRAC